MGLGGGSERPLKELLPTCLTPGSAHFQHRGGGWLPDEQGHGLAQSEETGDTPAGEMATSVIGAGGVRAMERTPPMLLPITYLKTGKARAPLLPNTQRLTLSSQHMEL